MWTHQSAIKYSCWLPKVKHPLATNFFQHILLSVDYAGGWALARKYMHVYKDRVVVSHTILILGETVPSNSIVLSHGGCGHGRKKEIIMWWHAVTKFMHRHTKMSFLNFSLLVIHFSLPNEPSKPSYISAAYDCLKKPPLVLRRSYIFISNLFQVPTHHTWTLFFLIEVHPFPLLDPNRKNTVCG
jgi:hypothetical protein